MRVTCVVDDAVQRSSSFWGEHGIAFLIETGVGRVLFDAGQSGAVLLHNLELLGVDPATIDALAISHAHYDHSGGLRALLELVRPGVPLYANPDLFRQRFSQREDAAALPSDHEGAAALPSDKEGAAALPSRQKEGPQSIGLALTREELAARLTLKLSAEPQEIIPGVWTTGEILDRPDPMGSSDHHFVLEGGSFVADPYLDDMALVLEVEDELVLLCGCCHAGLLNTLAHVQSSFERPIVAIAGGLHLTSASADHLQRVGEVLARADERHTMESVQRVYPNHCTGEAAFIALTLKLGPSIVHACPAGTVMQF